MSSLSDVFTDFVTYLTFDGGLETERKRVGEERKAIQAFLLSTFKLLVPIIYLQKWDADTMGTQFLGIMTRRELH